MTSCNPTQIWPPSFMKNCSFTHTIWPSIHKMGYPFTPSCICHFEWRLKIHETCIKHLKKPDILCDWGKSKIGLFKVICLLLVNCGTLLRPIYLHNLIRHKILWVMVICDICGVILWPSLDIGGSWQFTFLCSVLHKWLTIFLCTV